MKFVEYLPNLNSKTIFSHEITKQPSTNETLVVSKPDFSLFKTINCSSCHATLLLNTLILKNAPSEYWHDLLDCWACHDEDYNSKLKGHKNGKIQAKKGVLLLFDTKLMVHESDIQGTVSVRL